MQAERISLSRPVFSPVPRALDFAKTLGLKEHPAKVGDQLGGCAAVHGLIQLSLGEEHTIAGNKFHLSSLEPRELIPNGTQEPSTNSNHKVY